jgi:hypothetical protein
MKAADGNLDTHPKKCDAWHFFLPFPITALPKGLRQRGEEGIDLEALRDGMGSGVAVDALEGLESSLYADAPLSKMAS